MSSLLSRLDPKQLGKIQKIPELKNLDVKTYLRKMSAELRKKVKHYICFHGLTAINTPEEREELADPITEAIGKAIPAPYNLAWPVLQPVVKEIVIEMLKAENDHGKDYCKDVSCTLSPFLIID